MIRSAVKPAYLVNLYPPQWIPDFVSFLNFRVPCDGPFPFTRWFENRAKAAVLSFREVVISCSLVGFGFARLNFRLRNVLFIVVFSTMTLPEHIRLIPTYLLCIQLNWIITVLPPDRT